MSMETTCPKCHTTFRVTTEQLNAHQGDVRCGVCATAFNAFDSLAPARESTPHADAQLAPEPAPPPELTPSLSAHSVDKQEVIEEIELEALQFDAALAAPEPAVAEAEATIVLSPDEAPVVATPAPSEPAASAMPHQVPAEVPELPVQPEAESEPPVQPEVAVLDQIYADYVKDVSFSQAVAAAPAVPAHEAETGSGGVVAQSVAAEPVESIEMVGDEAALATHVSDIQPRPALEAWEAPAVARRKHGVLWGLAGLLLLLVLAVQAGYFYRVELAANYPAAKPLLEQACAWGHCSVPLPRNAELLKIESSDLEADTEQPAQVTLASVVSNRARYAQAYPLLELTLTNQNDQMVARRVFKPAEYLMPGSDAARGMPANSEISVRLALDLGELNAVGYRLYVFYAK